MGRVFGLSGLRARPPGCAAMFRLLRLGPLRLSALPRSPLSAAAFRPPGSEQRLGRPLLGPPPLCCVALRAAAGSPAKVGGWARSRRGRPPCCAALCLAGVLRGAGLGSGQRALLGRGGAVLAGRGCACPPRTCPWDGRLSVAAAPFRQSAELRASAASRNRRRVSGVPGVEKRWRREALCASPSEPLRAVRNAGALRSEPSEIHSACSAPDRV